MSGFGFGLAARGAVALATAAGLGVCLSLSAAVGAQDRKGESEAGPGAGVASKGKAVGDAKEKARDARKSAKGDGGIAKLATPEREAAARRFAELNHPELLEVLDSLREGNREAHERAILDLFEVSEQMAELAARSPERHAQALEAWKANSRVDLLAARHAHSPSPATRKQLREALESQLEAELRKLRAERDQLRGRLGKVEENLERLESQRARVIENRLKRLSDRGETLRERRKGNSESGGGDPR